MPVRPEDYASYEARAATATGDAEFEAFTAANPLPPPQWDDIKAMRETSKEWRKRVPGVSYGEQFNIKMRDGYDSPTRIFKPSSPAAGGSPLVVLIFGGGFCVGDNEQLAPYADAVSKLYGATGITVSYRLAPEYKFPTAPNDVWDSMQWLVANATSLGADPKAGLVVGGVSAGGNLTAVTVQRWVDEKMSPPITGQWLSIPLIFHAETVPDKYKDVWFSREQNYDAPIVNGKTSSVVNSHMQPDSESPLYMVYKSPTVNQGIPPTYVQVAGMDPLRDDGLVHEAMLRDSGVKTRLDVYPGVPHGHFAFFPFLKAAERSSTDSVANLGWLLGKEATLEQIQAASRPPSGA